MHRRRPSSAPRPVVLPLVFLFGLMLLLSPSLAPSARADGLHILRITTTGSTSDPTCGTSWGNPCALQYALDTLATTGAGTTYELWVGAGVYKPSTTDPNPRKATFQLKSGVVLYGGFPAAGGELAARDIAANETILSGDLLGNDNDNIAYDEPTRADNAYHVVKGGGTDNTAVLDGFTVRDGNSDGTYNNPTCCGGGMLSGMLSDGVGDPTVRNVIFVSNSASRGGGMFSELSSPILTNVTFTGNGADFGGGMHNQASSSTLTNVTFSGNSASIGGGMNNVSSNPTLTNITFSGNSAGSGGGMYNLGSSPTLTNVTFSGNTAYTGGAMHNSEDNPGYRSSPTILNAIVWSDTSPGSPQIVNSDYATATISYSVIQGGCPEGSVCTTTPITEDPLLGPLGNYGGATQTVPLLPGSSAIDAGNYAACTSAPVGGFDQRGISRAEPSGHCDLGAYESRGFTLAKSGGSGQSASLNTSFALPLEITFGEAGGSGLAGVVVTYTAPSSGARATWSASTTITQTTDGSGIAAAPPPMATGEVGSYPVSATVQGLSSPVNFNLTNLKANTTTTLASAANPSVIGQAVTLTASVGGLSPTGQVNFKDGVSDISDCVARPLSGTSATCTLASLTTGTHAITAVYNGDAQNGSSTSNALSQVVNKASTTTTIASSPNPSATGGSVVFTVTVSAVAPATGTPTGTVEFYETLSPSTPARTARKALAAQPLANGVATFSVSSLVAGTHSLLAVYSGDAQNLASTSSAHSHIVNERAVTVIDLFLPFLVR